MLVGASDSDIEEKEKFRLLFETIDTDKNGTCSREELTVYMKRLFFKPEEIESFIELADSDQDGKFFNAMKVGSVLCVSL